MTHLPDFSQFEASTNIEFNDPDLIRQAFTHRSYLNENRDIGWNHNERLEFLGDAVLELVVTEHLFQRFPNKPEGRLTAIRAALVNTDMLSEVADELNMGEYLLLSRGEAKDTGRAREFILANTFESVVGAIYQDQGFEAAQSFIEDAIFDKVDHIVEEKLWQDPKSKFQEEAQDEVGITPTYELVEESGPDHDKRFEVGVFLEDEKIATGVGKSKQDAEREAAEKGLEEKDWS